MPKPFDSKVAYTRDDEVPFLEFEYRQSRMTQGQQGLAAVAIVCMVTIPLAPIPWLLKRRQRRARVDDTGIRMSVKRFGKWREVFFAREHVQRLRTHKVIVTAPVAQVVFDFGVKMKVLFDGLSEPELLWMHDEVQSFIGRHWLVSSEERL